ncbi:M23 family metallopeptidase [Candidatus Nesciobacter abundans]|uniref:M23 family metallopeptidase n=1 Tax=Candidatus Nesciobacter abundans TaxID=2601668 RepID=A0A5C0UGF3_9PROT|nr:M23 family metallopeptidase [Candidatus Nesciobacter abundans]QEK39196.1 M23 family metallopeptidase [Candidatus Nesciobacter abundans]
MIPIFFRFLFEEMNFWVSSLIKLSVIRRFLSISFISFSRFFSLFRLSIFLFGSMFFVYFIKEDISPDPLLKKEDLGEIFCKNGKIDYEGVGIALSKHGVPLMDLHKIIPEIKSMIPGEWIRNATISTKLEDHKDKMVFKECTLKHSGYEVLIKNENNIITSKWKQESKKQFISIRSGNFPAENLSKHFPDPMVSEIVRNFGKLNLKNKVINISYDTSSRKGCMPVIKFIGIKDSNGGYASCLMRVSGSDKLYNPIKECAHNEPINFIRPVDGRVSSPYGMRLHPVFKILRFHQGIDYASKKGTPIRATAEGVVNKVVFSNSGYGNMVEIIHFTNKGKIISIYGHLHSIKVSKNQKIASGQNIGCVGDTGVATAPHLHFGLKIDNKFVNPSSLKVFYKSLNSDVLKKLRNEFRFCKSKFKK